MGWAGRAGGGTASLSVVSAKWGPQGLPLTNLGAPSPGASWRRAQYRFRLPGGAEAPRLLPAARVPPPMCDVQAPAAVCFPINRRCSAPQTSLRVLTHLHGKGSKGKVFLLGEKAKGEKKTLPDRLGDFPLPGNRTKCLCSWRPIPRAGKGARGELPPPPAHPAPEAAGNYGFRRRASPGPGRQGSPWALPPTPPDLEVPCLPRALAKAASLGC